MRALCIGGTGVISSAVAELAVRRGWEVIALNRGNREVPAGVMSWQADIRQEREVAALVERVLRRGDGFYRLHEGGRGERLEDFSRKDKAIHFYQQCIRIPETIDRLRCQ
ncbi:MAG: hypothetical protein ACLR23_08050 [Clostridia bacterium]